MSKDALFHTLSSSDIAQFIASAQCAVCDAGPGIQVVIYNETVDPVSVVTAYFDDEVKDL